MVDIDYFANHDKINNAECRFLHSYLLSCLNIFCGWVFSIDCYCSISSFFDQLGYSFIIVMISLWIATTALVVVLSLLICVAVLGIVFSTDWFYCVSSCIPYFNWLY